MADVETDRIANAEVSEADVTPAMIEAGADEFYSYDSRYEDVGDVVRRIWIAMAVVRNRLSAPSPWGQS